MDASNVNALIAICGTLAGALGGAGVTIYLQNRQREHQDRTRFHSERLAAYADLLRLEVVTAREFVLSWQGAEGAAKNEARYSHMSDLMLAMARVRLIGSIPVVKAADAFYGTLMDVTAEPATFKGDAWAEKLVELRNDFTSAARDELGSNFFSPGAARRLGI